MAKKPPKLKGVPKYPKIIVIYTQYDLITDISCIWQSFRFASNAGDNANCYALRIEYVNAEDINENLKDYKNSFVYLTNNVWKSLCNDVNNEELAKECCTNIATILFKHKAKLFYRHSTDKNELGILGQEILKNADLYLYNGQVMAKDQSLT